MNNASVSGKLEDKQEIREIKMPDETKNVKKKGDMNSLIIMTAISLLIMFLAVGMIYYFIKNDPELVHRNDQTVQVQENEGFVNPDSIQKLENDDTNITVKPVENSTAFIICGVSFMVVMAGAFIFVKVAESKDD